VIFLDFEFILTLSRPTVEWQGKRGRVTSYLNKLDNDAQIFICGNGNMVNDVAALLEKKGVNRKDILFEKFN
jgi:NAD(P)H-flavin reductase